MRKYFKCLLLFLIIVLCFQYIFTCFIDTDSINFFCFSHAIKNGQILYKDINIITTPLFILYSSLGLYIFDNYLMYIIEYSFLVLLLIIFCKKILKEKFWIFLCIILLFFNQMFYISYNLLCLLFIVILFYLEKEYSDKDYLIGFIIGLCIMSKHIVGVFLIIPTIIICFKDKDKLFKRIIGFLIPCFIFLFYLIYTNSLYDFFNLCLFGLFDFGSNNTSISNFIFIDIIIFIIMIIIIFINKKDKYNYYLPCSFIFIIPLCEWYHSTLFIFLFVLLIFNYIKINNIKYFNILSKIIVIITLIIFYISYHINSNSVYYNDFKYFNTMYYYNYSYKYTNKLYNKIDNYCMNNKCLLLDLNNGFYNTIKDKKIDYYSVMLYGNSGYNGTKRFIKDIKSRSNTYFIFSLDKNNYKSSQMNKEVFKFIINNYKLYNKFYIYDEEWVVYYKE